MTERGTYKNINRGRQLLRFDGIRYGNITPTDDDVTIEYKDRIWVKGEIKMVGVDVSLGQRLMLERFVNDTSKAGKHSIAIIGEHNIKDTMQDVYLKKDVTVREFYSTETHKWRPPTHKMSFVQMSDTYISLFGDKNTDCSI